MENGMSAEEGRGVELRYMKRGTFFCLCIICGVLLAALEGCMVGPDFHPLRMKTPSSYSGLETHSASAARMTEAPPSKLADWWKGFNDPVLSSLVERAIASNLDLKQAESRIRQARAARGVVASAFWPEVDAGGSYTRGFPGGSSSRDSQGASAQSGGASTDSGRSQGNLFQLGLDAAWEIDIFGGVRRNIEASNADIQASVEDRRDVLVSLVAEVGADYAGLRGIQQQLAIARKNLASQEHTAEITRKRYEAGFASALDVARAQAQAASTSSQIPVLESAERATIYSLGVLLGREPASLVQELSPATPVPPVPPEIPVGLPSDLLRRRPDIRRAEAQVHAATARIGVATADLFPKFSLTGSMGVLSTDLSSLANWSSRVWSMGPSVTWPIFTAGRIRSNIQVQNELQEQALLTYDKTVLTAMQDVDTALVAYAKELQHNKALTDAVRNYRKAVDLAMKLYMVGKTDFLNVLTAQAALYLSETALSQSTTSLTTDVIALYKALGGGWNAS
jgi:multidrug efflux system outer membrane protein